MVSPKGILNILSRYCLKVKYCAGNIAALKNEVGKGNPVIAMIRVLPDQNWLHFVPIVGYDEQYIFLAESMAEEGSFGNRKRTHEENRSRRLRGDHAAKIPSDTRYAAFRRPHG